MKTTEYSGIRSYRDYHKNPWQSLLTRNTERGVGICFSNSPYVPHLGFRV